MINVDELRSAPVAILGGGAVGKTCGADCALAGQEVRICDLDPFFEKTLGIRHQELRPSMVFAVWVRVNLRWQRILLQSA